MIIIIIIMMNVFILINFFTYFLILNKNSIFSFIYNDYLFINEYIFLLQCFFNKYTVTLWLIIWCYVDIEV